MTSFCILPVNKVGVLEIDSKELCHCCCAKPCSWEPIQQIKSSQCLLIMTLLKAAQHAHQSCILYLKLTSLFCLLRNYSESPFSFLLGKFLNCLMCPILFMQNYKFLIGVSASCLNMNAVITLSNKSIWKKKIYAQSFCFLM